jgi:O-antigen ligase
MNQHHVAAVIRGRVMPVAARTAATGAVLAVSVFAGATATGVAQARLGAKPALMLMGALAAGGLLAVFARARHQVLFVWPVLTGALFPFIQVPKVNPVVTFDRVWVGSMIAAIAGVGLTANRPRARVVFTRAFLALAVVWGIRSFLAPTTTRNLAIGTWIDALVVPYMLFTATRLFGRAEHRRHQIAAALMLGGVVLAAIGIAESIFGFELASRSGGSLRVESELATVRISGPYPVPEPYALSLLMTFAATLYWTQLRGAGRYVIGYSAAAIQLAAVGLTLFRAAWIGAALIAFVAIGVRRGRWPRALYVGAIMGAILFSAVTHVKHNTGLAQRVDNTDNIWGRLATYEQGLGMFTSHPLLGVGVTRYHAVAVDLPPRVVHGVESVTFPHSSFILVLAEQGLVGIIPLLLLTFTTWRLLRALRRARAPDAIILGPAAVGAALAYLVMSLSLTMITYGSSNSFFAMILGLVAGSLDGDASAETGPVEA